MLILTAIYYVCGGFLYYLAISSIFMLIIIPLLIKFQIIGNALNLIYQTTKKDYKPAYKFVDMTYDNTKEFELCIDVERTSSFVDGMYGIRDYTYTTEYIFVWFDHEFSNEERYNNPTLVCLLYGLLWPRLIYDLIKYICSILYVLLKKVFKYLFELFCKYVKYSCEVLEKICKYLYNICNKWIMYIVNTKVKIEIKKESKNDE